MHQEDEPEDDLVEDAEDAVERAAGGLRGLFGGAARKSKAAFQVHNKTRHDLVADGCD